LSCNVEHRSGDLWVCRAPAQIAAHPFANCRGVARVPLADTRHGRNDLPRGAIPALERVMLDERCLYRMQVAVGCQALHRYNFGAFARSSECHAGVDPNAADQHRACAAGALVAAFLRPRKSQVLAKKIEQAYSRLDPRDALATVHDETQVDLPGERGFVAQDDLFQEGYHGQPGPFAPVPILLNAMVELPYHVAECDLEAGRAVYAVLPPHAPNRFSSLTPRSSIGVSFSGHRRPARRYGGGPALEEDVAPGAAFIVMSDNLRWLSVAEPCDAVEFQVDTAYLRSVARDLGTSSEPDLPDIDGVPDAVVWGVAARFRASLRGGVPLTDVRASSLILTLITHVLAKYGGLRQSRSAPKTLDSRRLCRVTEYIDAHLDAHLTIPHLARAAALSPYYFARSFLRTTGLTPHAYVTARRMERARHLAVHTELPTGAIAPLAGYSNVAHFRAAFSRAFGLSPAALRRRISPSRLLMSAQQPKKRPSVSLRRSDLFAFNSTE
jgi:AraC family transcriptional regulator